MLNDQLNNLSSRKLLDVIVYKRFAGQAPLAVRLVSQDSLPFPEACAHNPKPRDFSITFYVSENADAKPAKVSEDKLTSGENIAVKWVLNQLCDIFHKGGFVGFGFVGALFTFTVIEGNPSVLPDARARELMDAIRFVTGLGWYGQKLFGRRSRVVVTESDASIEFAPRKDGSVPTGTEVHENWDVMLGVSSRYYPHASSYSPLFGTKGAETLGHDRDGDDVTCYAVPAAYGDRFRAIGKRRSIPRTLTPIEFCGYARLLTEMAIRFIEEDSWVKCDGWVTVSRGVRARFADGPTLQIQANPKSDKWAFAHRWFTNVGYTIPFADLLNDTVAFDDEWDFSSRRVEDVLLTPVKGEFPEFLIFDQEVGDQDYDDFDDDDPDLAEKEDEYED